MLVQIRTAQGRQSRKTVTIVFSDLVDSTSMGESLDAESLREVLNKYFDLMRAVLEGHGGVVEKFIGDAIMAVFGLPRIHEDDARRAVHAAAGMRVALADLNEGLSNTHGLALNQRTGVNTGVVVVGEAAWAQRLATGDAVNVAARLEQAAPPGGVVLGPDTFRLVQDIVDARPLGVLRLKGRSDGVNAWELIALRKVPAAPRSEPSCPLIGRESALADIEAHLVTATKQGSAELVLVVGEPGVGKSRLVNAFSARIAPTATILSATCQPYGASTFWPVAELLRGTVPTREPVDRALLRTAASGLPAEERDAIVERVASLLGLTEAVFPLEELFRATGRLLGSITRTRPLVLVVEDLQFASETLLDLLDHLRSQPRRAGTLILSTARPEVLESRDLGDAPQWDVMRLTTLTAADCDKLIDGVLGGPYLSQTVRATIYDATGGNALFVEQVLAMWIEDGVLATSGDGWTMTRRVTDISMPLSISAIMAARLDGLPDEERLVLAAAAVVGNTFERAALPPMLDEVDPAATEACVARLTSSGLLVPVEPGDGERRALRFEHKSLREVAYAMSLKSDRAALHERYADWIEMHDMERPKPDGLLGHHLAEACRYHAELRQSGPHRVELALRSAHYLILECRTGLRIGDRNGAESIAAQIVELLVASGPEVAVANLALMEAMGKLLVTMGRWHDVVTLLSPCVDCSHGPLLRDLGVALCQIHRSEPQSVQFREGRRLLEVASTSPNNDPDALASLAGSWKGIDDLRAQSVYRQCLTLDPADPYALGNVLEYEIAVSRDLSAVDDMLEHVLAAHRRCRSQARAGENLPWSVFDAAKFALLLGRPYEAIVLYARAVHLATSEHSLVTTMESLAHLTSLRGSIPGSTWAHTLLAVARYIRFPSYPATAGLANVRPLTEVDELTRVVMLAGGTGVSTDEWLERHGPAVLAGFTDFRGVVVSGGTKAGIAGLAGSLRERIGDHITVIGYLPTDIPDTAIVDERYNALRRAFDGGFSIGQSLQTWVDLLGSGADLARIKMLGINGGTIARAEYRVALALGCTVGIVVGSGRAADRLLEDADWASAPNLVRLNSQAEAVERFLASEP